MPRPCMGRAALHDNEPLPSLRQATGMLGRIIHPLGRAHFWVLCSSQNHTMAEVEGTSCAGPSAPSSAPAGPPQAGSPLPCPGGSWRSPKRLLGILFCQAPSLPSPGAQREPLGLQAVPARCHLNQASTATPDVKPRLC